MGSWFLGFLVSWFVGWCFVGFLVSWLQSFLASKLIGFLVSELLGFEVLKVSTFNDPYHQNSISRFLAEIDPMFEIFKNSLDGSSG